MHTGAAFKTAAVSYIKSMNPNTNEMTNLCMTEETQENTYNDSKFELQASSTIT